MFKNIMSGSERIGSDDDGVYAVITLKRTNEGTVITATSNNLTRGVVEYAGAGPASPASPFVTVYPYTDGGLNLKAEYAKAANKTVTRVAHTTQTIGNEIVAALVQLELTK